MSSKKINIKSLEKDIKKTISFEQSFSLLVSQQIIEKKEEIEREQKVIFDRFMSTVQGKEIVLENHKIY